MHVKTLRQLLIASHLWSIVRAIGYIRSTLFFCKGTVVLEKTSLIAIVSMIAAGGAVAIQGPLNGMLGRAMGSPVNAALLSFAVGFCTLAVIVGSVRIAPDAGAIRALPWYAFVGGVCGALYVASAAYAAPRIGATQTLMLTVIGQLTIAMALDHFGALRLPVQPVSLAKLAGIALVISGVVLFRKG